MDLQASFGEIFFKQWRTAGLADPQPFLNEYIDLREHGEVYKDWMHPSKQYAKGITGNQLRSVYGFGAFVGLLYSELLGLTETQTKKTADWCGQFNLGISLFDFISDEMNASDRVAALNVFQPFQKKQSIESQQQSPEETLLSTLASTILSDVQHHPEIVQAMQSMFEAEQFVSKNGISQDSDLQETRKALSLKSAEPFRVMALYTANLVVDIETSQLQKIIAIGNAMGNCYWIMDDAKDIWIDFEENHWNYFLLDPVAAIPHYFGEDATAKRNLLIQYWENTKLGEEVSMQMIQQLENAIQAFQINSQSKERLEGLIGASLWQWYYY